MKVILFGETLKRHQTRPNCHSIGEKEMRSWWCEKDFSTVLSEITITNEKEMEDIVADICSTFLNR